MPVASSRTRSELNGEWSVLTRELKKFVDFATKEGIAASEKILRSLRHGIDAALFRLRAKEIFKDPATRRWAADARRSHNAGEVPGLELDELKRALEKRRTATH